MNFNSTRVESIACFIQYRAPLRFVRRVSVFCLALFLLTIQMLFANGQPIETLKVTVELRKGESLENLFQKIESQTDLLFAFDHTEVKLYNNIELKKATRTVKQTLDLAFQGTLFQYRQAESTVIISTKKLGNGSMNDASDFVEERPIRLFTVSGKVTDVLTQEPMPGVNIIVKGTNRGTSSDAQGRFVIDVEASETLVFSFIGFKPFETQVSERSMIDVALEQDIMALNEVVVNAGYYDVKEREQTGNISRVTAETIGKQPVSNPLQALQGRMPGVYIQQQTGIPGSNLQIRIRGQNSLRDDGNEPLYIIDGVPFTSTTLSDPQTAGGILPFGTSPLNGINPHDIESIEILKDADATSIYGSRGANGVVLITTKKGKIGKTHVDLNFYRGVSKVASKIDLLSTSQYLEMRDETFVNDGTTPGSTDYDVNGTWDQSRETDWQKTLLSNTANTTDIQLKASGGSGGTQFLLTGAYHRETVPFPGDNSDQRISTHLNLYNISESQKLKTNFSSNFSSNFTDLIASDLTPQVLGLPPNAPALYDENGELNWENSTWENPLRYLETSYEAVANTLISNLNISYELIPELTLKANAGYTSISNQAINLTPNSFYAPSTRASIEDYSKFSNSNFRNWILEPQINWKSKLGAGEFDFLAGTSFLDQHNEGMMQVASGFSSKALMKTVQAATTVSTSNTYVQYRYAAVFGRINYSLNKKYVVNMTGRRDGSSRFGPGKQFANFGALGAAWIFSEEAFIRKAFSFLSFGKLRASYGITGSDQIGDYQYLDTSIPSYLYIDHVGLRPTRLSNPEFAWETNKKLEIGLTIGLWQNRIEIENSFFQNHSSNQLVGNPLPPTTGFSVIQSNFPATVQNTGIEIELKTVNVQNSYLEWTTNFNITIPKNKLIEFPNLAGTEYASRYVVGEPLTISKRYHYLGVDPSTGLYRVKDVNGDGKFNADDRTTPVFTGQYFYGGLQNTVHCKGIELQVFFQFVRQQTSMGGFGLPGAFGNQPTRILHRWQQDGDHTDIQLFSLSTYARNQYDLYGRSEATVGDASFIRLKNVSLSYNFPAAWSERLRFQNATVFLQCQNLLTLTSFNGLDPETGFTLPPMRVMTIGMHISL